MLLDLPESQPCHNLRYSFWNGSTHESTTVQNPLSHCSLNSLTRLVQYPMRSCSLNCGLHSAWPALTRLPRSFVQGAVICFLFRRHTLDQSCSLHRVVHVRLRGLPALPVLCSFRRPSLRVPCAADVGNEQLSPHSCQCQQNLTHC